MAVPKGCRTIRVRYPKKGRDGQWVVITTFWLQIAAADAIERARDALDTRHPGAKLLLTDAGRTHAQQVALKAAKPRLAATPGRSWHEAGLAVDVDMGHLNQVTGSQAESEKFLAEFGWKRSCWETWHFEYWPGKPKVGGVTSAIAAIGNNR